MAEHDEHDEHGEHGGAPAAGGDPAGGRHGGKDGGKGGKPAKGAGKLLSGPHGTEIMVICSVVLVGFGYLSIRRNKGAAAASPAAGNSLTAAAAGLAGTGSLAGFDQNAYLGLQTALANQSDQLASLLSAAQQGAGGLPAGLPDGTTPQTSPSLPTPLPNNPAPATSSTGSTSSTSSAGQWNVGAFGNYLTPTTGVRGPIGTSVYDTAGADIGKVTSYTFNGLPNVNYNPGTTLTQAEGSAGQSGAPVWTKNASGTYSNQWGNTAKGLDQYGTPIF